MLNGNQVNSFTLFDHTIFLLFFSDKKKFSGKANNEPAAACL